MPLQFTTIVVMILFAYMFALMNAGLISARIAEARLVQHQSRLALRNGANRYTDVLRDFVHVHGTQVRWPTNITVGGRPFSVCSIKTQSGSCSHTYTYAAHLTNELNPPGSGGSDVGIAVNELSQVAGESRVSAHITVTVLGATGSEMGSRSADLVFRVFNTTPYAIVSGMRDSDTVVGKLGDSVGDSGGHTQNVETSSSGNQNTNPTPNPSNPSVYTDTTVHTSLRCVNVTNPFAPQDPRENDGLPWASIPGKAYGIRCVNSIPIPFPQASPQSWINDTTENPSGSTP